MNTVFEYLHRDKRLLHRDKRLLHCDKRLLHCDKRLLHHDKELLHRDKELLHCDKRLLHCDKELLHCDKELLHRDKELLHCGILKLQSVISFCKKVFLQLQLENKVSCRRTIKRGLIYRFTVSRFQYAYFFIPSAIPLSLLLSIIPVRQRVIFN
jgi:hypothetical protein